MNASAVRLCRLKYNTRTFFLFKSKCEKNSGLLIINCNVWGLLKTGLLFLNNIYQPAAILPGHGPGKKSDPCFKS